MTCWIYQDSRPSPPLGPKGNSKFEILLVKIFSLKQKTKSDTFSYYRKYHIFTLQENSLWFFQITVGKCKTKSI